MAEQTCDDSVGSRLTLDAFRPSTISGAETSYDARNLTTTAESRLVELAPDESGSANTTFVSICIRKFRCRWHTDTTQMSE